MSTHVVIVGVEPNEDYARNSDGWTEDIFGPFEEHEAAEFAKECEDVWKAERKRRRKNGFPYGTPYTKVRVIRGGNTPYGAGAHDAALNWVKEN